MQPSRPKVNAVCDALLVAGFLAAICLPLADNLLRLDPSPAPQEQRTLAPPPAFHLNWSTVETFPKQFQAFYNDHFGFRSTLIRLHNRIKTTWLAGSTAAEVLVGKDGWLFYTGDASVDSYRATRPFSPAQLQRWQQVLEERRNWLRKRGIAYVFLIAPDKHTIYPEFMPDRLSPVGSETRLNQLVAHLRAHSDLVVVDPRPALLAAKTREPVYHRTDTHWNQAGAFIAYRQLLAAVVALVPRVDPPRDSDFRHTTAEAEGGDLARMLGLTDVLRDVRPILEPRTPRQAREVPGTIPLTRPPLERVGSPPFAMERENPDLPRAIFFCDSFFIELVPLVAEHFRRSVFISQFEFDCGVIEREKPDVVIQEIAERRLMTINPENPPEITEKP